MFTVKTSKERLFEAFNKAGLGHWVQKPFEQDQFELHCTKEEMECEEESTAAS